MDDRLAQAIEATRAGNTKAAQLQLTRLLKEKPDSTQGWYLLSMLVDSGERQIAFLNKVLALDPNHTRAQKQLADLKPSAADTFAEPPSIPVTEPEVAFEEQETGASLPQWLAEEGDPEIMKPPVVEEDTGKQSFPPVIEEIPSWLERSENDWVMDEPPTQFTIPRPESNLDATVVSPQKLPADLPTPDIGAGVQKKIVERGKPAAQSSAQARTLNLAILVLILLALLIVFLLVRELIF